MQQQTRGSIDSYYTNLAIIIETKTEFKKTETLYPTRLSLNVVNLANLP